MASPHRTTRSGWTLTLAAATALTLLAGCQTVGSLDRGSGATVGGRADGETKPGWPHFGPGMPPRGREGGAANRGS